MKLKLRTRFSIVLKTFSHTTLVSTRTLREINIYHNYNTFNFFSSNENLEFSFNSISTI